MNALAYDYRDDPGTAQQGPKTPPRPKRTVRRPRYARLRRRQFLTRHHFEEALEAVSTIEMIAASEARSKIAGMVRDIAQSWHKEVLRAISSGDDRARRNASARYDFAMAIASDITEMEL